MKKFRVLATTTILAGGMALANVSFAKDINVVASIQPLHSLVSAVMEGVDKPDLLVPATSSPHTFTMRPSQARALSNADVVFWIGKDLESFLPNALEPLPETATTVSMIEAKGMEVHEFRDLGDFRVEKDDHDHDAHDDHDHDDHDQDDHAHDDDHEHGHKEAKAEDHDHDHDDHAHDHDHDKHEEGHEDHADHDHGEHKEEDHAGHDHDHAHDGEDPHIWLDPHNAVVMVKAISETLAKADPDNAATYMKNAQATIERLETLEKEVDALLGEDRDEPFVVFHDAYQYFEKHFGLHAAGAITLSPEIPIGAEGMKDLRERMKVLGVKCIFAEPQFSPKLIKTASEGLGVETGTLDPQGAAFEAGPDHYFETMKAMGSAIGTCLNR